MDMPPKSPKKNLKNATHVYAYCVTHVFAPCREEAFRRQQLAVFVDGCFWHGCPRHCRMPRGNRQYWQRKIARNMARDRRVTRLLRSQGWRVLRIWGHALASADTVASRIISNLSAVPKRRNNARRQQ
jgi:DNA mismatch endonuclease Vsr